MAGEQLQLHHQDSRTSTEVVFQFPPQHTRLEECGTVNRESAQRRARRWGVELEVSFTFLRQKRRQGHERSAAASVKALAAETSGCCFNIGGFKNREGVLISFSQIGWHTQRYWLARGFIYQNLAILKFYCFAINPQNL